MVFSLFPVTEDPVKMELGDIREYCSDGIKEADACGDREIHAEFLMQSVILDVMDGKPIEDIKQILNVRLLSIFDLKG